MPSSKLTRISKIEIKGLFDMYSYKLDINSGEIDGDDKVAIFYGDNGCGKSTLLRLAFHMLAPDSKKGHKSHLMNVEFKELSVVFNDNSIVKATRKEITDGAYEISVKRPRKKSVAALVNRNDEPSDEKLHDIVEPLLDDLGCTLYLLSDDRAIHRAGGSQREDNYRARSKHRSYEMLIEEFGDTRRHPFEEIENPEDLAKQLLTSSIKTTEDWFRRRVIGSSTRGESGVNDIYKQILKRISDTGGESASEGYSKKTIEKKVNELELQSKNYAKYGLSPTFDGKDIVAILKSADKTIINVIVDVLTPYLDSMETKHKAMLDIYERIDTFITVASDFYTNKKITYNLRSGIEIKSSNGTLLKPHMLSSGERHLLLLFCTSIIAGGSPSILMIDEPEISLNIKWQRMLVDALIKCIGDNDIQFIFSTHSFEILSKHKSRVVKLENTHG